MNEDVDNEVKVEKLSLILRLKIRKQRYFVFIVQV